MYTVKCILKEKGYGCTTITPETSVHNALRKMTGQDIGALVVMRDEKVVGIFSERDYVRKSVLKGNVDDDAPIKELMTEAQYTVGPDTRVIECMEMMTDRRVRHLPVLDNGKLVGIVSIGDVVNWVIKDQKNHIERLEDYITGG